MKRLSSIAALAVVLAGAVAAGPILRAQSAQTAPQKPTTTQKPDAAPQAKPATPPPAVDTAKPAAPAIEQPADFKAFNEAANTTDASKRIEAFEKFLRDYPDSALTASAETQIRTQSLSLAASATKKYQAAIDKMTKDGTPLELMRGYAQIATDLNRSGIMLDQAEDYALKALKYDDVQKFIADSRATSNQPRQGGGRGGNQPSISGKLPPNTTIRFQGGANGVMTATLVPNPRPANASDAMAPAPSPRREISDDDLRTTFASQRGTLQVTLGQIYLKRGKNAEAEKTLKLVYNDASLPSSAKVAAARVLADVARKANDNTALLDYLTVMTVAGSTPEVRKELGDLYKKTHGGSLDGLDKVLDDRYHASVKPLEVKPFVHAKPKGGDQRLVLAELLTGAACPPCVGADMAFDGVLERYSRQDVTLVVYHQHIPGPDPMTNPATQARGAKDGVYKLQGVPTFAIDGESTVGGGGADAAPGIFKTVSETIEKELAKAPEAKMAVKVKVEKSTIVVTADVSKIARKSQNLKLQIALVEEQQRYSGPNGIRFHPMVVRSLAGADFKGFAVPAKGTHVEYTFDLAKILADNKKAIDEFLDKPFRGGDKPQFTEGRRDDIDASRLMVVAFVQDEDPKQTPADAKTGANSSPFRHVLQAAMVKVPAPAAVKKTTN